MKNRLKKHPNAATALVASLGLGSLVVQAGSKVGLHLDAQEGLYVAGGLATVALFVGRNGFVGTWEAVKKLVLHGTSGA